VSGGAAAIAKNSRMLMIASLQGGVGRRYSRRAFIVHPPHESNQKELHLEGTKVLRTRS